jgi:hypothetical protein
LIEARGGLFAGANARRLTVDLILQHLCARMGVMTTQPDEMLQFCQQQSHRQTASPLTELFAELAQLYQECQTEPMIPEPKLARTGRVVGLIHNQLNHEH